MSRNDYYIAQNPELWKYLVEECTDENGILMQEKVFPMRSKTLKTNNMKQNIEIDIPQGYEFDFVETPKATDAAGILKVILKKKNNKDFDFYVDEYLRSDYNTTNDMLCNLFTPDLVSDLKFRLKRNKLQFVPWEIKVGLAKFICKDKNISLKEYLYPKVTDANYHVCDEIGSLLSDEFKRSIV